MYRLDTCNKGAHLFKQILLFSVFSLLVLSFQNCADSFVPPESLMELGSEQPGDTNPDIPVVRSLDVELNGLSSVKAKDVLKVAVIPSSSNNILNDLNLQVSLECPGQVPELIHSDSALLGQVLVDVKCDTQGTAKLLAQLDAPNENLSATATKLISITQPDSVELDIGLSIAGTNAGAGIDVDEVFILTADLPVNLSSSNLNFEVGSANCSQVVDANLSYNQAKFKCTEAKDAISASVSIINTANYHGSASLKFDVTKIAVVLSLLNNDFFNLYVNTENKISWGASPNLGANQMLISENVDGCVASFSSDGKINLSCSKVASGTLTLKVSDSNRKYKGSISKAFSVTKKNYSLSFSPSSSVIHLLPDGNNYKAVTKEITVSVSGKGSESVSLSVSENSDKCSIAAGSAWNKKKLTCTEPTTVKISVSASSSIGQGSSSKTYTVKKPYKWIYFQGNSTGLNNCDSSVTFSNMHCSAADAGKKCKMPVYYSYINLECKDDY
jgi:hypothetical protein